MIATDKRNSTRRKLRFLRFEICPRPFHWPDFRTTGSMLAKAMSFFGLAKSLAMVSARKLAFITSPRPSMELRRVMAGGARGSGIPGPAVWSGKDEFRFCWEMNFERCNTNHDSGSMEGACLLTRHLADELKANSPEILLTRTYCFICREK